MKLRRPRSSAAAIVALLALAAIAGGCGGGSDDEAALRKKLQTAAAKISEAKSLRASVLFEVEEEGVSEEAGCIELDVDGRKPESFDLAYFDLNCSGGSEAHELIAVGRRAWTSIGPEGWREATIDPRLLKDVDDEQTDLRKLFAAAENIEARPEGAGTEFADTSYTFDAPASAFPGSDEDLEDVDVEFEAVVEDKGYLSELIVRGDAEGTGVTVTDSFEDVGRDLGIEPPDRSEVHGPVTRIGSRQDLEELVGAL